MQISQKLDDQTRQPKERWSYSMYELQTNILWIIAEPILNVKNVWWELKSLYTVIDIRTVWWIMIWVSFFNPIYWSLTRVPGGLLLVPSFSPSTTPKIANLQYECGVCACRWYFMWMLAYFQWMCVCYALPRTLFNVVSLDLYLAIPFWKNAKEWAP